VAGSGLEDEALEIRALSREDLPFLLQVRNECRNLLHDNRAFTLAECQTWFAETRPDFRLIQLNGAPIGYFRLSNYDSRARSVYVGADLHPAFRGRGLGRAIYRRFLPVFAAEFGLTEVRLEVLSHNARARHLYETLGFRETGRHPGVAVRDGARVDSICLALRCTPPAGDR
jgi:RimJ/RimL family protein N-acetyltransferase